MSQRTKTILIGALSGALVGAVGAGFRIPGRLPAGIWDEALLRYRAFLLAGAGIWVLFSLYWEHAAKNAAPSEKAETSSSRSVHVILANAALLLEILPVRVLGRFLPVAAPVMVGAIVIEVAGLALAIWARRHLGRYWSGEIAIKVGHELIRSGPYRLLRHPIYTGLLTMYVGTAVLTGETLALLGLAVAVFAYWRKIRLEEANLRIAFGPEYETYCRGTWALLPGLY